MEYTIVLPDLVAQQLERVAQERRQAVTEVITELIARDLAGVAAAAPSPQPSGATPAYPLGVNPLERYMGMATDRFPHLTDDEVLAAEAGGYLRDGDAE
ncbi:MAG TPA: hypothetical protein VMV29_02030 [Ktedonobacterales bacterium]|nr:hypothetical protein [Ktedonobacterales bacterium]